jgi:hypothetical protein
LSLWLPHTRNQKRVQRSVLARNGVMRIGKWDRIAWFYQLLCSCNHWIDRGRGMGTMRVFYRWQNSLGGAWTRINLPSVIMQVIPDVVCWVWYLTNFCLIHNSVKLFLRWWKRESGGKDSRMRVKLGFLTVIYM